MTDMNEDLQWLVEGFGFFYFVAVVYKRNSLYKNDDF